MGITAIATGKGKISAIVHDGTCRMFDRNKNFNGETTETRRRNVLLKLGGETNFGDASFFNLVVSFSVGLTLCQIVVNNSFLDSRNIEPKKDQGQ